VLRDGSKTYVASERDAAVYVLNTADPAHLDRITSLSTGSHPCAMLFDKSQERLLVANADSDTVSIVDAKNRSDHRDGAPPPGRCQGFAGSIANALALSPDEKWLYVRAGRYERGGRLSMCRTARWKATFRQAGIRRRRPRADGKHLLVANAKGTALRNPNPVPGKRHHPPLNVIEGSVITVAIPDKAHFKESAEQVLANNRLTARHLNMAIRSRTSVFRPARSNT